MGNKKTSAVWKHFNQVKLNGKEVTVCCLCKTVTPYLGNTTNLWFHLERGDAKHKEEYAALKPQKQPPPKRKRTSSRPTRLLDEESGGEEDISDPPARTPDLDNTGASTSNGNIICIYIFMYLLLICVLFKIV